MTYIIETNHLSKLFSQKYIIKDCNLRIENGTIYGLLGLNGAGKTTLFKLLLGLSKPTYGDISILGMDITANKNEILRQTGSIIESPIFFEHLSAYENLSIHLSYMGLYDMNIEETLELCGLSKAKYQPVSTFSLGMRQRLAIARSIVHNPRLLILDEPINGLDPSGIYEMRNLFKFLSEKSGMTILLSSHILSEIQLTADKIGILKNGIILNETSVENIAKHYIGGIEEYFINTTKGDILNE